MAVRLTSRSPLLSASTLTSRSQTSDIEWIRIKSDDGFSFLVDKKVIESSGTLRDMLDSACISPNKLALHV